MSRIIKGLKKKIRMRNKIKNKGMKIIIIKNFNKMIIILMRLIKEEIDKNRIIN